jgi:hypothetical protein
VLELTRTVPPKEAAQTRERGAAREGVIADSPKDEAMRGHGCGAGGMAGIVRASAASGDSNREPGRGACSLQSFAAASSRCCCRPEFQER